MSLTAVITKQAFLLVLMLIAPTSQSTNQNHISSMKKSLENLGMAGVVEHKTTGEMFPVVRKILEAPKKENAEQVNTLKVRAVITGHPKELFKLLQLGLEGVFSKLTGVAVDNIRFRHIVDIPLPVEHIEKPVHNHEGAVLIEVEIFGNKLPTAMKKLTRLKARDLLEEIIIQKGMQLHHQNHLMQVLAEKPLNPPEQRPTSQNTEATAGLAPLPHHQHSGSLWRQVLMWIALGGVLVLSLLSIKILLQVMEEITDKQKKHRDESLPTRMQVWHEPGFMGMKDNILFASDSPKLYHTRPKLRPVISV